jgi:hypothetical protein
MAAEPVSPWPRAARIARANGLGYLVCGLLTVLSSFPGASLDMLLGVALVVAGLLERRGAVRLSQGEPGASNILARNELALGACIVVYAVLRMTVLPSPSLSDPALVDALGGGGADAGEMLEAMARLVYGGVAVVALLYQGGMALYFSRYRQANVGL